MLVWLVFGAKLSFGRKIPTVGGNVTTLNSVGHRGYHSSHITKPRLENGIRSKTYLC